MTIAEHIESVFKKIARDFRALANRVSFIERSLNYLTSKVSTERSEPDTDGVYKCITHRRADGSILQVSRLEHDVSYTSVGLGVYNKRVTLLYNKSGDLLSTHNHHLKYDDYGSIVAEILVP